MSTLDSFFSVDRPYREVRLQVKQRLSGAGLRVLQTFDLVTARMDPADCPCPHHGTEECDCRMGVFLVYGEPAEPATLIVHGNDARSWVSLVNSPQQKPDPRLQRMIEQALQFPLPE